MVQIISITSKYVESSDLEGSELEDHIRQVRVCPERRKCVRVLSPREPTTLILVYLLPYLAAASCDRN